MFLQMLSPQQQSPEMFKIAGEQSILIFRPGEQRRIVRYLYLQTLLLSGILLFIVAAMTAATT